VLSTGIAAMEMPRVASHLIGYLITIPAAATLDIINKPLYLEEGDVLRLTSSTASKLEAVCSYEDIS
jgi:hypothetical protein